MRKKIYIAGPDVFLKNSVEVLNEHKDICDKYGYEGMMPFDANVNFEQPNDAIRKDIYTANVQMIRDCDIVIANMNNFRHNEQDSGTIFEIGFASALNKQIIIFSDDDRSLLAKTAEKDEGTYEEEGFWYDSQDVMIEDLGANYNLMISESTSFVKGNFEDAIKSLDS